MFIDTHAHLTDAKFTGEEGEIIFQAKQCKVEKIITSGFNLASSKQAVSFAQKHDGVFASIGIYPENIEELDDFTLQELEKLASNQKVVAIGEIGLQYTENMPDHIKQKDGFAKQIRLAHKLQKPIVIHCREAYGDTLEVLKANKEFLSFGGTLHCYGGSLEVAKEFISLGLYISVGGVSTFKNASRLQEVIKQIPIENILLETDCPYLAPVPFRGKRNQPSLVPTIAQNLANLKGISVEEVEKITTQNARRLFKI